MQNIKDVVPYKCVKKCIDCDFYIAPTLFNLETMCAGCDDNNVREAMNSLLEDYNVCT